MLRGMRERTKTILWIVVLTFIVSIFALWGMDLRTPQRRMSDRDVAGTVDKQAISEQAYNDMINQLYAQVRQQKGENYNPTDMERSLIADQAWELAIQGRLTEREIKKLGIGVSDAELIAFLRQNPHPSLQKVFKTESGEFDYQAYLKALSNPDVDWSQLEQWGRSVIPEVKLQTYLISQISIPEREILDRFKTEHAVMRAKYIEVPIEKQNPPYEPTDAEIRSLYEKEKDKFMDPAMRRLRVLALDRAPTAADEEDVRARLAEIRQDIVSGTTDFANAAEEYSDDNSTSDKGGDLGFLKTGMRGAAFDSVVSRMKVPGISEPFRTPSGYEIVQVLEWKKEGGVEEVHARHIVMKVEPGTDAVDSLNAVVRDISEEIQTKGLEKTALDHNLTTFDTAPFPEGMFIKELGFVPQVVSFAFNYKPGNVSYPIQTENKVYFVKILEDIPAQVRPLEAVRAQLVDEIRTDREAEAAKRIAETVYREALSTGNNLEAAARAKGFALKETPPFKEHDDIAGIGANTVFSVACKYIATGEVSPPIRGTSRYYVIKLIERKEPDMAGYAEARKTIVDELRNEAAQAFVASWYQSIRENAQVVDLRQKPLR
jgi:peptidyl-prolyl cis-trans isomerase D